MSFTHDQLFEASDFSSRDGYIATLSLLEQAPDLQGIIYAHDMMAIGGMKALREQGRRIPEDIAAIGFHNFEVASFTDPQLTSIGFDMYQMGCIAAQRLLTLMENRHDQIATTTLISTDLHVRSST